MDRLARTGGAVELLRLPAALYSGLVRLRSSAYDRGWLPLERVAAPVVSVGNLTAGGTGKTPMVAWLCGELARRGLRPGIASRGYGAARGEPNDEARELAELLPDVPHVQDADRARAARALVERGADVVVLDDGFQHRRLARDLDLVLVDGLRPWGLPAAEDGAEPVRALLPRGLLREPPAALGRANAVVLTRADALQPPARARLLAEIERLAPGAARLTALHRPVRLRSVAEPARALPLESLEGRALDLASAIGNPEGFEATVRSLGGRVGTHRRFPDHRAYAAGDLRGLGADGRWLVVTRKDAVKLGAHAASLPRETWALEVRLEVQEGEAALAAMLDSLPRSRQGAERDALRAGLSQ